MLILTRRSGENIKIGDDITVSVIEIRGNQVRLGIDAPRSVQVHREEIYEVIQEQNRLAALQSRADLSAAKQLWQHKHGKSPRKGAEK